MTDGIPEFPHFAPLALEHRGPLKSAFKLTGPKISEFGFGNLFIFSSVHDYRVSRWGELILVKAKGYDGAVYGYPALGKGDIGWAAALLLDHLAEESDDPTLFPVTEEQVKTHFLGPGYVAESDRDQADYLYLRENLANLPGKRYHKRKNRLNKFLREVGQEYLYSPLSDEHVAECMQLASGWCEVRCSPERPSTYQETEAALKALEHRAELGLAGGVILLDGTVRAYTLGEPLDGETFVVHFEKADPALEGLAQLINREFCRESLSDYLYVNREQDLGDEGLRRAKLAYHPERLVEKYRVRRAC